MLVTHAPNPLPTGPAAAVSRAMKRNIQLPVLLSAVVVVALSQLFLASSRSWGMRRLQPQPALEPLPLPAPAQLPPGFRFNKVVAIVAFDRYHYFHQVVDALRRAWGSEHYTVTITIDGPPANASAFDRAGWEHTVELSKQLQWLARNGLGFKEVLVNASRTNLGLWANKKRAVAGAMALSDFAVILEDDIVLEPDGLRWFEWHVSSGFIFRHPDVSTATCWSSSFPLALDIAIAGYDMVAATELGLLDKFYTKQWATPWGWALWRRTWDALGAEWTGRDVDLGEAVKARNWSETMPLVSRCNNIGSVGANKQGATVGHIHQRMLASGSFHTLDRCAYRPLVRTSANGPLPEDEVYLFARRGLFKGQHRRYNKTGEFWTLDQLRDKIRGFKAGHPLPSQWESSC